jgi:hypothetical protein
MTWSVSAVGRNNMLDAFDATVNTGGGTATMEIRSGTKPATPETAATGTLLVTLNLANPAFEAAAAGALAIDATPELTAVAAATGTAGYARIKDRAGTAVADGTVTATGGGGDVQIASTSIVSGTTVRVTGGSLTLPA